MDSPLVVQTVIRCPYYLILSNYVCILNTVNPQNLIKKFQPFLRINTKISSNQATRKMMFGRGVTYIYSASALVLSINKQPNHRYLLQRLLRLLNICMLRGLDYDGP